jgi:hypothetical protein
VLGLIAIGGVVIGLGIILLSPTGPRAPTSAPSSPWPSASGRPPTCYSIGTDPVPVLVLIVLLVEAAPFVALPMAMGMGAVLVDVVATGAS